MAASTSMTQAISQAPGSASSHSNAKLEGSQASQVSTTSRFVKITAKRMREHQADGVAGGGLYQLPNNVVLELPSAAWLTRKTRDLAWSRRSALPCVLLAFTLIGSTRVACSALPGPVLGFLG